LTLCQYLDARYTSIVLLYKHTAIAASLIGIGIIGSGFVPKTFSVSAAATAAEPAFALEPLTAMAFDVPNVKDSKSSSLAVDVEKKADKKTIVEVQTKPKKEKDVFVKSSVYTVPFRSQFTDISAPEWKKVGCGITSLAMLIDFYQPEEVTVDELLKRGIAAGAYSDAGWSHAGLINLSHKYGLKGESHDLSGSSMDSAFAALKEELKNGPVMASVHYTFTPTNPIPHIVVVSGVSDGKVYYNDPAGKSGGGSISIAKFQGAWKKRYIDIRPT
jgi:uncharacterized protein YvpB